ncbi:MAG: hypothetical protein JWR72_1715 [Flavisolibacter sp.]|jgi:hypothetical protein|nr:hypothetical protein [Flavisolibacter sp.]
MFRRYGSSNGKRQQNTISTSAESGEEAHKLYNGLSAGGQIEVPITDSLGVHTLECFQTNFVFNR